MLGSREDKIQAELLHKSCSSMPYCSMRYYNYVHAHCKDGCWGLESNPQPHSRTSCATKGRAQTPLKDTWCPASIVVLVMFLLPVKVMNPFPYIHVQPFKENKICFSWTVENLRLRFSASIKFTFRLSLKLKSKSKFRQACFEECCKEEGFLDTFVKL